MLEVFEKLKELQKVLPKKYDLQVRIEDAPKKLSSQEELLARLKKEYIEKNAIYEEVRKKIAHLKVEAADVDAARQRSEEGMDSITTHREYEALEKEISDANEKYQTIKKELEKEEKYLAELDDSLKNEEELIKRQEEELEKGKASLQDEIDRYTAELEDLNGKEADLEPGIDPEILFKFQRIIKSKNSEGIVAVKGNVCEGCHMILPAQFANEVHTGDKIVFCPYCSRILYYEEMADGEEHYFPLDDTGSLADLDDEEVDEDEGYDDSDSIKELDY